MSSSLEGIKWTPAKKKLLLLAAGVIIFGVAIVGVSRLRDKSSDNFPTEETPQAPATTPLRPSLRPTSAPLQGELATGKPSLEDSTLSPTTQSPTSQPSTLRPTLEPTKLPTLEPTKLPTPPPTLPPTPSPTSQPTTQPTQQFLIFPTSEPTLYPSSKPVERTASTPQPSRVEASVTGSRETKATYVPGDLTVEMHGLLLSTGLTARLLAKSGDKVKYDTGGKSAIPFHFDPDAGATFDDPRTKANPGGWIYVSNSETKDPKGTGGVGALTFNSKGQLIDYKMVLEGTTANCGGGKTPWNSWISCEEYRQGLIWQVDPTGRRTGRNITLGSEGGLFESFAYTRREQHFFVTEDHQFGPLRKFVPAAINEDPWETLYGPGETTYLRLIPSKDGQGKYEWVKDKEQAKNNANSFYPYAEGIDVYRRNLYFISKQLKTMFVLDLDGDTYTSHTTRSGLFDGQPDQIQRILGDENSLLYFTEDDGKIAGVHARDQKGRFFSILEGPKLCNETTGLAFSPSAKHMYIAYQDDGLLFEITRDDGLRFDATTLNVKYHNKNQG